MVIQDKTDGEVFQIVNAAGTDQITHNTSTNIFNSSGTISANELIGQTLTIQNATNQSVLMIANSADVIQFQFNTANGGNLLLQPSVNTDIFTINNATGTNQLNFNTITNQLTLTGNISCNNVNAVNLTSTGLITAADVLVNLLNLKPTADGAIFNIENAAGTELLAFDTSAEKLSIFGNMGVNDITASYVNIVAASTNALVISNASNIPLFTFSTVGGGNFLLKPSTDDEIFTINNASGTKQLNFNTSTNTLTGTGTLNFPIIEANSLTSLTSSSESVLISPVPDGVCFSIKDDSTYHNTLLTFDTSKNQLGLPKDYASIFLCTGNSYGYLWTNYYGPGDVLNLSFNYYMVSPVNGGSASAVIPDAGYAPAMISLSNGTIAFQIASAANVAPSPVCSISSNTLFPASSGSFNIGSSSTPLGSLYSNNVNATTLTTTTSNAGTINLTNNIVPTTNNSSNLGSSSLNFNNGYITNLDSSSITCPSGSITLNSGNLIIGKNGTGNYNIYPQQPNGFGTVGTISNYWSSMFAENYTTASDKRLKEKIKRNALGLDFINKISTVSYNYRNKPNRRHHGLIAQELEELLEKEQIESSFIHKPEAEDDPNTGAGLSGFYAINYNEFIAPLIKAVQELTLKVERLENELGRKRSGLEEPGSYASGSGDEFETVEFSD